MSTANQHDWRLWLLIRRIIDSLFGEEATNVPECSATENPRGLTVHQELYVRMRSESLGHFYQQPRGNSDPLDQLLLPGGEDAKDAKIPKRDSGKD